MAGLLGEIYSAGNVARRKLTDLLGNPLLSAQQFVGNINDRARALNELTAAAAREGIDYGPASQQLGGLMAEGYNPMGLTVYHGSPAKFSKFDRTKIGSGEGAQAYGYGHYVAESPAVAKGYQEKLSNTGGAKRISSKFGQLDDAITEAQGKVDYYENLIKQGGENVPLDRANSFLKISKKNLQDLQDMKAGVPENKGAFYEIDLLDEQIARMLDYDNPVDETIRSRVSKAAMEKFGSGSTGTSGELLYKELTKEFQNLGSSNPAADASEFLRAQGVSGIKFLDQNSRSNFTVQNSVKGKPYGEPVAFMTEQQAKDYAVEQAGKGFGTEIISGTSNFVVFPGNEGLLTIQKRNNEAIAPTSLLGDNPRPFETTTSDASEIFGQGAKRVKYIDPNSGGVIDVLQKPDGTASILGLEVPEAMRGQGIGQSLQSQVMQDFPEMMGQVSSKAAAKTAYRLGRRPPNQPEATLDDVYKIMDEYSSVNLVSPDMQKRFMQSLLD